jgi:hypothetical protein
VVRQTHREIAASGVVTSSRSKGITLVQRLFVAIGQLN